MTIKIPTLCVRATALEVRSENLPDGVCGIVTGIAVRYGIKDSWGTQFRAGAFDKTRGKVAARKVKFYANHGAGDSYGIRTHIGTVVSLVLAGDAEVFTAHLFDTEEGHHAKRYLESVQKQGAETGASVGFFPVEGEWLSDGKEKYSVYEYHECALEEISLAPRQAVPGATITGVRNNPSRDDVREVLRGLRAMMGEEQLLALVREHDSSATDGDEPSEERSSDTSSTSNTASEPGAGDEPTDTRSVPASMADRLAAVRSTFTITP
jgi:HK97 family phage prohead protease